MEGLSVAALLALSMGAFFLLPKNNTELENVSHQTHALGFSAQYVDWDLVPNFSPDEFGGALQHLDAGVVYALQKLRDKIGRIMISPADGAVFRFRTGSMHDASGGKLSKAIDIMPMEASLNQLYFAIQNIPEFGGVGLYPNWSPRAGAHVDIRVRKDSGALYQWAQVDDSGYVDINEALA